MIATLTLDVLPADWGQLSLRWTHFVAGVLWIGLLWFFNWVNGPFMATLDAETKKKVVPELMPRALFWFRWGAAITWLSGVLLAWVLYYSGSTGYLLADGTKPELMQWLPALLALLVGFVVYDLLFNSLKGNGPHAAGVLIWAGLVLGYGCWLDSGLGFSNRATFIHMGALLGTTMAANVWMRIWPAQRRIITGVKSGQAADPSYPALAGLRSKHNTYMSVPLLLLMVSVHQDGMIREGIDWQWMMVGVFALGWVVTYAVYKNLPKIKGF